MNGLRSLLQLFRITILCLFSALCCSAQFQQAPLSPPPDDRYKADILVIVAHPDDETEMTGYLARAIFDQHRRVAVLYGTRGNSGGNVVANEQAASLGAVRDIEARRGLATYGVMNVWFIGGPDTPSQNVLYSLETWNHGAALWQTVRIVRLTRPEVILTWLPDYVIGENHGDHQAAGVLATEAFDMAGDPTVFPEQLAPPRNRFDVSNLTEGLHPWQPKKIYYSTDASHLDFVQGKGPQYSVTDISPSRNMPYYRLKVVEEAAHLTQGDTGAAAEQALRTGNFQGFMNPEYFILGKSLVTATPTGDIFEGVAQGPLRYSRPPGYRAVPAQGLSIELGGPWAFYRQFWPAHGIEHLANLLAPEAGVSSGETLQVPLLLHNEKDQPAFVNLSITTPVGWIVRSGAARYALNPRETYPVEARISVPAGERGGAQAVRFNAATLSGTPVGSVILRVAVANTMPQ